MPLILNQNPDPCFDLRKRVVWDPESTEQILEAQEQVDALRASGYRVEASRPGETVLYPPRRDAGRIVMRVLDESGDTRLVWDRHKQSEVDDARKAFNTHIAQGYRAYVCRSDGTKGRKVESFDALLEELILLSAGDADKHDAEMGWKPAEVVLVPKTMPG